MIPDALVVVHMVPDPIAITVRAVHFLALRVNQYLMGSAFSLPYNCNAPNPNPSSASQTLDTVLLEWIIGLPKFQAPFIHNIYLKKNVIFHNCLAHCHESVKTL